EEIEYYIDNYQPYDKAGAYAIQEWIGMIGIERMEGDYFNVVGLPLFRLNQELKLLGFGTL
ncbi:MAG: septum formation protein, partial [Chitinophagales bacterium]